MVLLMLIVEEFEVLLLSVMFDYVLLNEKLFFDLLFGG